MELLLAGLDPLVEALASDAGAAAATAILTTDLVDKTVAYEAQLGSQNVRIGGMAKGSGMIHPDMATMLGFVTCDAGLPAEPWQAMVRRAVDRSFNSITVDGDVSTNDCLLAFAAGAALPELHWPALEAGLTKVCEQLARAITRDGEGATKFMTIEVLGGKTSEECRLVAKAVAHSPLVKTAFFASDPNLGRILAAIGYAGITDLDVDRVQMWLGDVWVAKNGGRNPDYLEADGQRVMQAPEITVKIDLGRGNATQTMWTCDLSHDYVSINADYRS